MSEQYLPACFKRIIAEMIQPGDRLLAAVSGGADSVALLYLLCNARNELRFDLALCHLNHKLRGADADRDEHFVRELADRWSVPGYFAAVDVQAERKARTGSLEEVARDVRYEFYAEAAEHFRSNKLALAHHRDDQVETVLFNLIRGCAIHGLRGMPSCRSLYPGSNVTIIRPLLGIAKAELLAYLRARAINWCEDHTNYQPHANRNVIRHELLPAIESMHSGFADHLLQLAHQAAECEQLIDKHAHPVFNAVQCEKDRRRIETWRLSPPTFRIVAGEVVRTMMIAQGVGAGKITRQHIESIMRLIDRNAGRVILPQAVEAWIDGDWLCVGKRPSGERPDLEKTLLWRDETCHFAGCTFTQSSRKFDPQWLDAFCREKSPFEEALDSDKLSLPLLIRYAQPGETFHPLGAPGEKKIGDFLTDHKVPLADRPALLVADQTGPIWLVGQRIDERVKIAPTTQNVIILTTTST
jgi:tRNA(Ile)-lysidine synthase